MRGICHGRGRGLPHRAMGPSDRKSLLTASVILCLVALLASPARSRAADVSGLWMLSATGESVGCTQHTPCGGGTLCGIDLCRSFSMGGAIHVSQSGAILSAAGVDVNSNPFTLGGAVIGAAVTFTIQGTGITPGIGPAATTYTGTLDQDRITGTFAGHASWTYQAATGGLVTETATWTGTFTVTIRAAGSGSVAGTVSYAGNQTGTVYVGLFRSTADIRPGLPSPLYYASLPYPGRYIIPSLPDGTYYVGAILINDPITMQDPYGLYGINKLGGQAIPVTISGGSAVTGIDISLFDGTAEYPNPFYAGATRVLSVTKAGDGGGMVLSKPYGIKCGSRCSYRFEQAAKVTLLAIADAGSSFSGWSGACSGQGACVVSMESATGVGAVFQEEGTARARTTLALRVSGAAILKGDRIDAAGRLTRLPDMEADLSGLTVQVTITAPDGTPATHTTTTQTRDGLFSITGLAGFDQKGRYRVQASFSGSPSLLSSESTAATVEVAASPGYAVIVEGSVPSQEGLESHNKTTNRIYQGLRDRGFSDDAIAYFNYDTTQPGVDGAPTKGDIQTAVETWARDAMNTHPGPVYVIMVDHGNSGAFYIGGETIAPNDLSSWLAALEAGLNPAALQEARTVIIGACYSGSFIPALSGRGRIIITSARTDEQSFKGMPEDDNIRSGEFFLDELFSRLVAGYSFSRSFEQAAAETFVYTRGGGGTGGSRVAAFKDARQHPLLDDDGDGKGSSILSSTRDGSVARELYLGVGTSYSFDAERRPAEITKVTAAVFLGADASSARLWAKADKPVSAAWIQVRPPSLNINPTGGSGQAEIDLPRVPMECSGPGDGVFCEVTVASFTEPGRYEISYYVKDQVSGAVSPLKGSVVYKAKEGNDFPAAFSLVSPSDGATEQTVLTLDWEDSSDPDGLTYTLVVSKNSDFSTVDYIQEDIPFSTTAIGLADLLSDVTVWYWRVLAIDPYGGTTESSQEWNFLTINNNTNGLPGIVSGYITDAFFGAGIPGASVTLSGGGMFTSLPDGYYFMSAPAGDATVGVSANGYRSSEQALFVTPGDTLTENISLQAGAAVLADDLSIHVPLIDFDNGTAYAWADFAYEQAGADALFRLTGYGVTDPSGFAGFPAATLDTGLRLHMPQVLYEGMSLWGDLECCYPTTDGSIVFRLTAAGFN